MNSNNVSEYSQMSTCGMYHYKHTTQKSTKQTSWSHQKVTYSCHDIHFVTEKSSVQHEYDMYLKYLYFGKLNRLL